MSDHVREQRVAGDVDRHAEALKSRIRFIWSALPAYHIAGTLVKLAREFAVAHVELAHGRTRRQRHLLDIIGVPCGEDDATALRVGLDLPDHPCQLTDALAGVVGLLVHVVCTPMAPLKTGN